MSLMKNSNSGELYFLCHPYQQLGFFQILLFLHLHSSLYFPNRSRDHSYQNKTENFRSRISKLPDLLTKKNSWTIYLVQKGKRTKIINQICCLVGSKKIAILVVWSCKLLEHWSQLLTRYILWAMSTSKEQVV